MQDSERQVQDTGKSLLKNGIRAGKLLKRLLPLIKPLLPFILIGLLIFIIITFIIGLIYNSTPQGRLYHGPQYSEEDEKLIAYYQKIADKNNKRDRWLMPGEPSPNSLWTNQISTDKLINPGTIMTEGEVKNIVRSYLHYYTIRDNPEIDGTIYPKELSDYYGTDSAYLETFGQIHAGTMIYDLVYGAEDSSEEFKEKTGVEFRPYFYYKLSHITISFTPSDPDDEGSTTVIPIYLLVEADTISEHTIFNYRTETEVSHSDAGTTTITKEVKNGQTQVRDNTWQRLDDWVKEKYDLKDPEEISMARTMVWEAGIGYTKFSEHMDWLFSNDVRSFLITGSFVPLDMLNYFNNASKVFDIPPWFLSALANKESSFNPDAINKTTGATGLFQLMATEQKWTVDQLVRDYPGQLPSAFLELYNSSTRDAAFYQETVKDPWINTLAGCLVFKAKSGNQEIDWDGDWQNQVLPALAKYGGYAYIPEDLWDRYGVKNREESYSQEKINRWCRDEYAGEIFKMVAQFKIDKKYPINGMILASQDQGGSISSDYGWRIRPSGVSNAGAQQFHSGIDLAFPEGTPVYATMNGMVTFAGWGNNTTGNKISISNGRYLVSYMHLSQVLTTRGSDIIAGTVIGAVGNTGDSSGPHLHFQVQDLTMPGSKCIDPKVWLLSNLE